MNPVPLGDRRELFTDSFLIERLCGGAMQRLHRPERREVALTTDRPWEGSMSCYACVLRDGDVYRLYYIGWELDLEATTGDGTGLAETHPRWVCMAESRDGLAWTRPEVGLVEHAGSTANNIVWRGDGDEQHGVSGFSPFLDENPDVAHDARYKAVGGDRRSVYGHLYAMASPDGVRWRLLRDEPILLQGVHGTFDSPNRAFWDVERGEYRLYFRDYIADADGTKRRGVKTCASPDFLHWSEPVWLDFPGAPAEEIYTNQVQPYFRAPHILIGFPSRYVFRPRGPAVEALPEPEHRRMRADREERFGAALTDGLFMTSRDGTTFHRWGEAFLRPGPQLTGNWAYGDNYQAWGLFPTPSPVEGAPDEISFLVSEGRWRDGGVHFRRHAIRQDGFVSVNAPLAGGELLTRPFTFRGCALEINFATSAAGSIRFELQDADGNVLPGFAIDDCHEQIGDELDRTVAWRDEPDLAAYAGTPVRLRAALRDADLYAIRFASRSGASRPG